MFKTKDIKTFDVYWRTMEDYQRQTGLAPTTGEVAKLMGVAYATARKYLKMMLKTEQITCAEIIMPNGTKARYYAIVSRHVDNSED